jgi:hypothetical protein
MSGVQPCVSRAWMDAPPSAGRSEEGLAEAQDVHDAARVALLGRDLERRPPRRVAHGHGPHRAVHQEETRDRLVPAPGRGVQLPGPVLPAPRARREESPRRVPPPRLHRQPERRLAVPPRRVDGRR